MSRKKVVKQSSSRNYFAPDYVMLNGHVYEKLSSTSHEVDFDLEEDVLSKIDGLVKSGKYVSRGDAVRDILRSMIREHRPNK